MKPNTTIDTISYIQGVHFIPPVSFWIFFHENFNLWQWSTTHLKAHALPFILKKRSRKVIWKKLIFDPHEVGHPSQKFASRTELISWLSDIVNQTIFQIWLMHRIEREKCYILRGRSPSCAQKKSFFRALILDDSFENWEAKNLEFSKNS